MQSPLVQYAPWPPLALSTQVPLVLLRRYISAMPRASDGPPYGLRRIFNRSRALRLSSALKLTLRAMMLAPFSRSVAIVSVKPQEGVSHRIGVLCGRSMAYKPHTALYNFMPPYFFPCAGKAGLPPLNLYARVRFFVHLCTRDRGCSAHPVFPAPSEQEGGKFSSKNSRR